MAEPSKRHRLISTVGGRDGNDGRESCDYLWGELCGAKTRSLEKTNDSPTCQPCHRCQSKVGPLSCLNYVQLIGRSL